MDLGSYIERIEATPDPAELERIRAGALTDGDLDGVDKTIVNGRVGRNLADLDRDRLAQAGRTDYALEDVREAEE